MTTEHKKPELDDPQLDADPLNDLVRLLNEEDPFADFAANRSRDFYSPEAGSMRPMPQEVNMDAPQAPFVDEAASDDYDSPYDDYQTSSVYAEPEIEHVAEASPAEIEQSFASDLDAILSESSLFGESLATMPNHTNDAQNEIALYPEITEPSEPYLEHSAQQIPEIYANDFSASDAVSSIVDDEPQSHEPEFDPHVAEDLSSEYEAGVEIITDFQPEPEASYGYENEPPFEQHAYGKNTSYSDEQDLPEANASTDHAYYEDQMTDETPLRDSFSETVNEEPAVFEDDLQVETPEGYEPVNNEFEEVYAAEDLAEHDYEDEQDVTPDIAAQLDAALMAAGSVAAGAAYALRDNVKLDQVTMDEQNYADDQDPYENYQEPNDHQTDKTKKPFLKYAALAACGIAAIGAGYFALNATNAPSDTTAPVVIKADNDGIKTIVANDGQNTGVIKDDKLIYDRVSGADSKQEERIVPRQEDVMPVQSLAVAPSTPDAQATIAGVPRRVQSVTINPDGSIVRAPAVELPQPFAPDLPNVVNEGVRVITANPANTVVPSEPLAAPVRQEAVKPPEPTPTPVQTQVEPPVELRVGESQVQPAAPVVAPKPQTAASENTQTVEPTQAVEAATPNIVIASAPVPAKRPGIGVSTARQPVLQTPTSLSGTPQVDGRAALQQGQTITAQPAPSQPAVSSNSSTGGFVVQLSAQRSQDEAVRSFEALQNRFPQTLGGQQANVQRADLGSRGVYYRLGVGPIASRDQAIQLCNELKSSGLRDCFVRAN